MSVLKCSDVSFSFGNRSILENASFVMQKGEHIGLIGLNGEGKSTFIKMITGELTPDSGKIEWSKTGNPRIKKYADEHKGKKIQDIWTYKDPPYPKYPTEKNSDITEIILTEGIFDVWAYHRIKLNNAVAVFGSSLSDEQIKLILQLNLDVTLSFDNDKAGNKATDKAIKVLKNKVTIKKINLPEGKDPADIETEELLKAYLNRTKIL